MSSETKTTEGLSSATVARAIAQAKEASKQSQILGDALSELALLPAAALIRDITAAATVDLAQAKAFLSLLDIAALTRLLGQERIDKLRQTFRTEPQFDRLDQLFEATAGIDKSNLQVVKARVAFMLQILYLLGDRAEEEGMPQSGYDASRSVADVIESVKRAPDAKKIMRIDLEDFGVGHRHLLVEILKEADFRSEDNRIFEMVLSEPVIRQYADGSALVSTDGGDAQTRMSDAIISRIGENLIKRLSLLVRTVSMYPSDHPGITPMIESISKTLSSLTMEKERFTISRLGTDMLFEDVRIKKKTRSLTEFAAEMEERNLSSITFMIHTTVEEIRAFIFLFALNPQQVRKKGGVKKILEDKGVKHIQVDQFKYGIIADDGTVAGESGGGGGGPSDKSVETAVLTEVITRMKTGQSLTDISAMELGDSLLKVLSDDPSATRGLRRSLAQLLLLLDPDLMDRAIFDKGIISEELSWASARKMVEVLIPDLEVDDAEMRRSAAVNLGQLAQVAVKRNKETTLSLIIDRLCDRLWVRERDPDVSQTMFEVLALLTGSLIEECKLKRANSIVLVFRRFIDYSKNLPPDRRDLVSRSMAEMAENALRSVAMESVVEALAGELSGDDAKQQELSGRIFQTIPYGAGIDGLLNMFLNPSRSVRNRAFNTLNNMGGRILFVCSEKLRNLSDQERFGRDASGEMLEDNAYFIVRNCIDLVARLGGPEHLEVLRHNAEDPDFRVRREVVNELPRLNASEAVFLARQKLNDPEPEVVECAVNVLGNLQAREHIDDLLEVLFVDSQHRQTVIKALAQIGGEKAESILLASLAFRGKTPAARVFAEDFQLRLAAVKALGRVGREKTDRELIRFTAVWQNPLRRLINIPLRSMIQKRELLAAVQDAQDRVRYRLQENRTEQEA